MRERKKEEREGGRVWVETEKTLHSTHYSCMTSSGQHEGCKPECWPLEVMQLFCWKFTL